MQGLKALFPVLSIGGLVGSIVGAIGGGVTEPTVWRVKDRDSFPLFACKDEKANIVISLKPKNNLLDLENNKEITFVAREANKGETVNLFETTRTNGSVFKLTIWKTGNSRLGEIGGALSQKYGDDLRCGSSVFQVTQFDSYGQWEKGFDKIKLTLDKCQAKNGQQVCEIKIDNSAEITWKPEFKPTVILS